MKLNIVVLLAGVLGSCLGAEPLKVALYVDVGCRGGGVVQWARLLETSPDVDLEIVNCADVKAGRLAGKDMLVMPGGGGFERYAQWKEEGCDRFRDYIRRGGAYFGTCCGLAVALNEDQRIRLVPFKRDGNNLRGGFNSSVKLLPRAVELLGIPAGTRSISYHNGPVPIPADPVPGCTAEVIGTYDCNLMERGKEKFSMHGRPAMIWATLDKGKMFLLGNHPEYSACNEDIIVGGIRALTGRTVSFPRPKKESRPLRVAYYCSEMDTGADTRAVVKDALKLMLRPDVDVTTVSGDSLAVGILDHVDALVIPGRRTKKLSVDARRMLDQFKGQIVEDGSSLTVL